MAVMRILQLFLLLLLLMQVSCQTKKEDAVSTPTSSDSIIVLRADYPESADTVKLSQIADTMFYVKLDHKSNDFIQIQYLDSLIFVQDIDYVYAYNKAGKLLYKVYARTGCFDLDPENGKFYTYSCSTKRIKTYDFKGKELKSITSKADEVGFYGASFIALNDSLFALSMPINGREKNELIFINDKGQCVKHIKNIEPFTPGENSGILNEDWGRTLFRTNEGLRYHRCYRDTLFAIEQDMTLRPILIEQKISKVELNMQTEGDRKKYIEYCCKYEKYAVKIFESSRYYIIEYLLGRDYGSLPNFLVYDKTTGKLNRIELDWEHYPKIRQFQYGIFNDYDGGLAFTPSCQSGDYLIMANAGVAQGWGNNLPKTLYDEGRKIGGVQCSCKSNVYRSIEAKKRADAFFDNLDEKENTMLTIVKLKK